MTLSPPIVYGLSIGIAVAVAIPAHRALRKRSARTQAVLLAMVLGILVFAIAVTLVG